MISHFENKTRNIYARVFEFTFKKKMWLIRRGLDWLEWGFNKKG